MNRNYRVGRISVCTAAVAFLFLVISHAAAAATISFDESAASNNNVAITNQYSSLGVVFGSDNSGTWGGIANGDPGTWKLNGTNGPAFLGNNGANNSNTFDTSIFFTTPVSSVSFDVSRASGSSAGQTLTVNAFAGSALLGSTKITLGDIDDWTTVGLNFAGIDKVVLDGSSVGFSPYGIDNLQFSAAASVPEPVTLWLLGAGLICLAGLSRRYPV